ncbi:PAS domain-containing protein [Halolamina litorea]|uniref:histidine kinase n=1 Tax=Halolamina litorea TaxID=1515593 RepID=A0ABD6BTS1_9EURY|nr:PAS domain-containing protein [Halolamina litorea]
MIFLDTADADVDAVRAAAPSASIIYCPPKTTADGVAAADAAGVETVLPQDAEAWGADRLAERVADALASATRPGRAVSVSDGAGSADGTTGSAGEPPAVPANEAPVRPTERPPARGILTVDGDGRISYVGERAADLLGREATALLDTDLAEALPWADLGQVERGADDLGPDDDSVSTVKRLMPANRWLSLSTHSTGDGAAITIHELGADERRRIVLDRLHGVSRRLFAAETPEAVANIAAEAVRDVLGLEVVVVRLTDSAGERLVPVAQTEAVDETMPDRPTYAVGEGMAGTAFETDSPQIRSDLGDDGFGTVRSAICLPLDDYGTISIGSRVPDAFNEDDVSLARLLSTTVRVALERAERESQLRRREAVLESLRGLVFVLDEDRAIDYVSTALAERLGRTREALVGEHVVEFIDVTAFYRAEQRIREGDDEITLDLRIDPPGGGGFPAQVELSVLERTDDGESIVGVVEDRSTLAETRADLRRKHERLWTLFENLPDPVVDAEHVEGGPVIRAANDAFAEVFDCDRDAIVGEPIDEVLDSPASNSPGSMPPEAINEQVNEGEVTGAKIQRETGRGARTFLFRGIPYAEEGTVRAFGIYTDVTEIERRERHVKVLDRLLRHNLRNDLGVVIGRAENVLKGSDDPEIREEARKLVDAADGLIDLSETAKRIRRIIEEPATDRYRVTVTDLLDQVAADARQQSPDAAIEAAPGDPDVAVLATPDLQLALEELVDNALAHGGDSPTVELRAEAFDPAPDEWVDLLVVDDGPGIPETERAPVTGDRDITQLQHGSGLGLWLVRWAVESVGGDLGFERRDGRTVVRLRLRRAPPE